MKYKIIYPLIVYLVVSSVAVLFVTSKYLYTLIYFVVSGVIVFLSSKFLLEINEKFNLVKKSSLYRLYYLEEYAIASDVQASINKANSKIEDSNFNLDYDQLIQDKTKLNVLAKGINTKSMELSIYGNKKISLKDNIQFEKDFLTSLDQKDYASKFNKNIKQLTLFIMVILLIRILFGNQVINYSKLSFVCVYIFVSLFPLIFGLGFLNNWRKIDYEN